MLSSTSSIQAPCRIPLHKTAKDWLQGFAFAFEDFNHSNENKSFQSSMLLSALTSMYLQDTIGWVDIPGLELRD
ncbi:hypothetical protein JVU11DRAFT_10816 [Chiua virens]|nr:hypothetical protein JVU11DRAFT_10816 [Chiua virens]